MTQTGTPKRNQLGSVSKLQMEYLRVVQEYLKYLGQKKRKARLIILAKERKALGCDTSSHRTSGLKRARSREETYPNFQNRKKKNTECERDLQQAPENGNIIEMVVEGYPDLSFYINEERKELI